MTGGRSRELEGERKEGVREEKVGRVRWRANKIKNWRGGNRERR